MNASSITRTDGAARALPFDATAAVVLAAGAAIAIAALVLRLYGLESYVTFYPDSYGQLRAAGNLASLEFPLSYHYPPGIAMVLAPLFIVLPDTLLTLQIGIMAAGLALIALAYVWCRDATAERRAALIYAGAVAIGATFVFHSRVALFEVVTTLLIGASIWLAPKAARGGTIAGLAFGVLVFAMVSARYTNVIVLPALLLAALGATPSWRGALDLARGRAALGAAISIAALGALYLATSLENLTRFTNDGYGSVIDLGGYAPRLIDYLVASLNGYSAELSYSESVAAGVFLAFAAIGMRQLWRANRGLALAIGYLVLAWGPVHAAYEVFFERYAMTPFFLLLLPAAIGLSGVLGGYRRLERPWQRVGAAGFLALSVTLVAGAQVSQDVTYLQHMYESNAAKSDAAYEEIRDALRGVDGERAVLISSQVLAVDEANREMEAFDLGRFSGQHGINEASVALLLADVQADLDAGRPVYYHYTPYEEAQSQLRRYELGFDAYFLGLDERFALTELARATERPHRLYAVEER